jgi:hypothetical protein
LNRLFAPSVHKTKPNVVSRPARRRTPTQTRACYLLQGGGLEINVTIPKSLEAITTLLENTRMLVAGTWTLRNKKGPVALTSHAMAYDHARQRTVMFGGGSNSSPNNATFEWDGNAWTKAAGFGPKGRVETAMVYRDVGKAVFLFGGFSSANG